MKLQTKIISTVITLSVAINSALLWNFISNKKKESYKQLYERIDSSTRLLTQVIVAPLYDMEPNKINVIIKSFLEDPEIVSISLVDYVGPLSIKSQDYSDHKNLITKKKNLKLYSENLGEIVISFSSDIVERSLKESLYQLTLSLFIVTVVIAIALFILVRRLTQPINELTALSASMADGNLDINIEAKTNDEIGVLANSFMRMRDSINDQLHTLQSKEFIISSASTAISTADLDGNITYVNKAFLSLWGADSERNIIGRPLTQFWKFNDKVENIVSAFKNDIGVWSGEMKAYKVDGTIFDVYVSAATVCDYEGTPTSIMSTTIDLTDQKRAEDALEKRIVALTRPIEDAKNFEFEDVFSLKDIQCLQDSFAKAVGVSSVVTRLGGEPITKPSGPKASSGILSEIESRHLCSNTTDREQVKVSSNNGLWSACSKISVGDKHIANWLIGQVKDQSYTEDMIRKLAREKKANEDVFIAAYSELSSMTEDQFKEVANALLVMSEQISSFSYQNIQQARFISERRKAEEKLIDAQNYITNIIDSMPSLLVGVDNKGVVTQWNLRAEKATGLTAKDARGLKLSEIMPELVDEMNIVLDSIRDKEIKHERKKSTGPDGVGYEDITIYPLIANGVQGAVIRVDDITNTVRMEEMMIQSEKMMSVGGLAAGMAHEINNPLAGMIQTADVLIKRLSADIPANDKAAEESGVSMDGIRLFMKQRDITKMLNDIRSSGTRAAEIVTNMLSFARRSNSAVTTNDIMKLVDQSLHISSSDFDLERKYDFRHIEVKKEYEANLPDVPCEASKIQQVLVNLLRNGAEAMQDIDNPKEKHLFVIRLKHEQDSKMVVIEIEDNGIGMSEETRKRIFEPFFTTKSTDKGTGLGLSVSYFIITENHFGEMSVESTLGQGTKFIIKLPTERKSL